MKVHSSVKSDWLEFTVWKFTAVDLQQTFYAFSQLYILENIEGLKPMLYQLCRVAMLTGFSKQNGQASKTIPYHNHHEHTASNDETVTENGNGKRKKPSVPSSP